MNFASNAIKRRQHSIERDVDVEIECFKNAILLRSKRANNHGDLENILKLLSSIYIHATGVWRSSAWKCSLAASADDNTILILFSEQLHSLQFDRAIDISSQARTKNFSSVKAEIFTHWGL